MRSGVLARISRHIFSSRSWVRLLSHIASKPRRLGISRRLKAQKARRAGQSYSANPRIGAVLQHFNKVQNIRMLWRGLLAANFNEVIVADDGSVDGSYRRWKELLQSPNQFLIHSNDLFEIVTYDRALHFSRAEIVCLLQDDDRLPASGEWVERALALFDEFPDLLILGGFRAVDVLPREEAQVAEEMVLQVSGDEEYVTGLFRHHTVEFPVASSPSGREDFMFVASVVRAPVFIRRREFLEIGGFDLEFAPFLCDDLDNCLRAWEAGYKVGLYAVDFRRDIGLGGMRAFNSHRMAVQVRKNWERIYQKHGELINSGQVRQLVREANNQLRMNPRK
jgi:GT2 family glycosyltransferase